jgi:hypothetical protein
VRRNYGCPLRAKSGHSRLPATVTARISDEHSSTGQDNGDFGELARQRIDFDRTGVLLDDDVWLIWAGGFVRD